MQYPAICNLPGHSEQNELDGQKTEQVRGCCRSVPRQLWQELENLRLSDGHNTSLSLTFSK